jgi:hypothetical protein
MGSGKLDHSSTIATANIGQAKRLSRRARWRDLLGRQDGIDPGRRQMLVKTAGIKRFRDIPVNGLHEALSFVAASDRRIS